MYESYFESIDEILVSHTAVCWEFEDICRGKKNDVFNVVLNKCVPACTVFQQLYIFLVLNTQRPVGEETENFTKEFTCKLV